MSNPRTPTRPRQVRKPRPRRAGPRAKQQLPRQSTNQSKKIDLSSVINGFFTFRTTVKDLSLSLQRLENIMDNAFRMFEMATGWMGQRRPGRRPPLRLIRPRQELDEDIPRLDLPLDDSPGMGRRQTGGNPLAKMMENVDMTQLFKLMQSPIVQQLLKGMMQARTSDAQTRQHKPKPRARKQG
ncbi:hypothetical protein [Desmospora activa]|uniref:Uncharacterized protein n=1 Tax=Desmospora activa DSM 45169 TaxID=1121389 RepID=A0A2T4Z9V2_9BACL|nr:hypothetical protein [Desmospora activa]PTM58669.1 hypothetical protein C8J48_1256 [Desmospora activa DSM 45169]